MGLSSSRPSLVAEATPPQQLQPLYISSLFQSEAIPEIDLLLWKLNLLAVHSTEEEDLLFLAEGSQVFF